MFKDFTEVPAKVNGIAATDYAARQKLLATLLKTSGTELSGIGTKLTSLPAPTFTGGKAFASKTADVMSKTGSSFTSTAKRLAGAPATAASLTGAASALTTQFKDVAGQISAVGELKIPDATKQQLLELPACATLKSTVGG